MAEEKIHQLLEEIYIFNILINKPLGVLSSFLPETVREEIFSSKIIESDAKLQLASSMVALKKVEEDRL